MRIVQNLQTLIWIIAKLIVLGITAIVVTDYIKELKMEYVIDISPHKVIIFTKQTCPFCVKAKNLLKNKEADYEEIDVEGKEDLRRALVLKTNGSTTVPQIFIKGEYIGGCDALYALDAKGELDSKLRAEKNLQ